MYANTFQKIVADFKIVKDLNWMEKQIMKTHKVVGS